MMIVADVGGSKGHWCLMGVNKSDLVHHTTLGYHPLTNPVEDLDKAISSFASDQEVCQSIKAIYYYGAACSLSACQAIVRNCLKLHFENAEIYVYGDLLGVAKGLCSKEQGVVGILGTGSSSGVYDGDKIIDQVPSLGFILGDAGSGTHFGKLFLRAYFYGELPVEIARKAEAAHVLDRSAVLSKIHSTSRELTANYYLGSFVPFIFKYKNENTIKIIIRNSFKDFIDSHIMKYSDINNMPVSFSGSVAWYFQDDLKSALAEYQLAPHLIVKDPMEQLIRYHKHEEN